jgi:hypothetical protein
MPGSLGQIGDYNEMFPDMIQDQSDEDSDSDISK